MPGLLGPTNPVPGYDAQPPRIQTPQAGDTSVQNIVNPNVVTRPDARTDRQDNNDSAGSQATRYESNFMTFLQRLRSAQGTPETFMRMLQWAGTQVSSGISSGFAAEMGEFLQFLQMDEGELLAFLQNQIQSGSRFSGALFAALRGAYGGTQSELLQNEILQFLRRYSDFSSTEHLEGKMLRTVETMSEALPGSWSEQLTALLAQLENGVAAGDRQGNLALLRNQLFPLISRYVSLTHDHGLARNLLSMLTLDVARYENGGEAGLLQSLRHLVSAGALPADMAGMSDGELLQMLRNTEFFKSAGSNAFADRMAELTDQALRGQGGAGAQEAFHSIMNAILINESVYMPLQHVMLPLEWNGELMFSELWIDPDADREKGGRGAAAGPSLRLLIKMDVESLGAFDLVINSRREGVTLDAACPSAVSNRAAEVSEALGAILRRNGLEVENVNVSELKRPLTVSEVFPKLYERMGGVNVRV